MHASHIVISYKILSYDFIYYFIKLLVLSARDICKKIYAFSLNNFALLGHQTSHSQNKLFSLHLHNILFKVSK